MKLKTRKKRARASRRPRLPQTPFWHAAARKLWLGDILVKWFRVPAVNQGPILNEFQKQGWPECIADPLPPADEIDARERLHNVINHPQRLPAPPAAALPRRRHWPRHPLGIAEKVIGTRSNPDRHLTEGNQVVPMERGFAGPWLPHISLPHVGRVLGPVWFGLSPAADLACWEQFHFAAKLVPPQVLT